MGFLNNTTITVDAILTKKGRELLAQGSNAFNITKFALSDDEVDYKLFDVTHPNGSDQYGSVIENMPLLEAFPDENHVMRYKLVTLPKNTQKMPIITVQPATVHFTAGAGLVQPPVTVAPSTANVSDQSYTFILHDQTVANMLVQNPGGGQGGGGATTPFFLGDDDAPNSKTLVAKSVRLSVKPIAAASGTESKSTQLTMVGNDTGATISITVKNSVMLGAIDPSLFG
tara:strand:- start:620 stop:1303 length:684 start_codon:yes stop_codon:yes gene_type:complete